MYIFKRLNCPIRHFAQLPKLQSILGEPVKNYLADFFPLRGGGTPHSTKLFWAEGGVYPNSAEEKAR